jgi:hypothetical protein
VTLWLPCDDLGILHMSYESESNILQIPGANLQWLKSFF